jgi:hypothetical protein
MRTPCCATDFSVPVTHRGRPIYCPACGERLVLVGDDTLMLLAHQPREATYPLAEPNIPQTPMQRYVSKVKASSKKLPAVQPPPAPEPQPLPALLQPPRAQPGSPPPPTRPRRRESMLVAYAEEYQNRVAVYVVVAVIVAVLAVLVTGLVIHKLSRTAQTTQKTATP